MENWQKAAIIGGGVALAVGIFAFLRSRRHTEVGEESAGGTTIWIADDEGVHRIVPNEKPDLDVVYNNVVFDSEDVNDTKEEYDKLASEYIPEKELSPECTLERITKEEFEQEDEYEPHSATWYPSSDILAGFDGDEDIIAFHFIGWKDAIRSIEGPEPAYFREKDALGKYVINVVTNRGYGEPEEVWGYK